VSGCNSRRGVAVLGECRCRRGWHDAQCQARCIRAPPGLCACGEAWRALLFVSDSSERLRHTDAQLCETKLWAPQLSASSLRLLCRQAAHTDRCHNTDADDDYDNDDDNDDDGVESTIAQSANYASIVDQIEWPQPTAFVIMLHNTRRTWSGNKAAHTEPSNGLLLFETLLRAIWLPQHTIVVHVDGATPRAWLLHVLSLVQQNRRYRSNVFVLQRRRRVVWSGASVTKKIICIYNFSKSSCFTRLLKQRWIVFEKRCLLVDVGIISSI
jgi:hypothetical protein